MLLIHAAIVATALGSPWSGLRPSVELLTPEIDQSSAAVIRVTLTNTAAQEARVPKDIFKISTAGSAAVASVKIAAPSGRVVELDPVEVRLLQLEGELEWEVVPIGGAMRTDLVVAVEVVAAEPGYHFLFAEPGEYGISVLFGDRGEALETAPVTLNVRELTGADARVVLEMVRSLSFPPALFSFEAVSQDRAAIEQIATTSTTEHGLLGKMGLARYNLSMGLSSGTPAGARQAYLDRATTLLQQLEPIRTSPAWSGRIGELAAQAERLRISVESEQ